MNDAESKKAYNAPRAKVIEVNVQNVLCQSGNTEYFTPGHEYNDWE